MAAHAPAYAPYRGKIRPTFGALRVRLSTVRREIRTRSRIYGVGLLNGALSPRYGIASVPVI